MTAIYNIIWDALRDLVPFVQFKKHEKHPWRCVTFIKNQAEACNFIKSNSLPWVFFTFFRLYKWHQIAQSISQKLQVCFSMYDLLVEPGVKRLISAIQSILNTCLLVFI